MPQQLVCKGSMILSGHLITLHAKGYKMVTGISRFTKGEFNQNALDEVWNKGKETFKDPIPPPSSGVELNSAQLIWDDMHEAPTGYPVATPSNFGSFPGAVYRPEITGVQPDWKKIQGWGEIEAGTSYLNGCGQETGTSVNTQVELSPIYVQVCLYSTNQWVITRVNGADPLDGGIYPGSPHGNPDLPSARPCYDAIFDETRRANDTYKVDKGRTDTGTQLYYPRFYYLEHYWALNGGITVDQYDIKSVYVCQFSRLSKIDPNGVDDFHLANFVTHLSADRKQANGSAMPAELRDINGISRYKTVPQSGDWMPMNSLSGFATEAEFLANPPPFPTTP